MIAVRFVTNNVGHDEMVYSHSVVEIGSPVSPTVFVKYHKMKFYFRVNIEFIERIEAKQTHNRTNSQPFRTIYTEKKYIVILNFQSECRAVSSKCMFK